MAEGDTQTAPDTGTAAAAAGDATQTQQTDGGGTDAQETQQQEEGTQQTQQTQDAQQADQQAPQLTPDQIEERAFQRVASWMGRREKETRDAILSNVSQLLDQRLPRQHSEQSPVIDSKIDAATLLDKPGEVLSQLLRTEVPKIINETHRQQTQAEQQFTIDFIRNAGSMMDSDPLFSGKEGRELGNEVVQEVLKAHGAVDRNLHPSVAAQLIVNQAVANVVRKRAGVKTNAFAGKQPAGKGYGTVNSPPAPAQKTTPIKLDSVAASIAKYFGNTEKEIQEFLK